MYTGVQQMHSADVTPVKVCTNTRDFHVQFIYMNMMSMLTKFCGTVHSTLYLCGARKQT